MSGAWIPTEKDISDAIQRMLAGDPMAMEILYLAYQLKATRAAYLILRDRFLAEDAVQIAFWNAYHSINRYDPARPFPPWFFKIVAYSALGLVRKRKRRTDQEAPLLEGALEKVDLDPSFDQQLAATETRKEVWSLLGTLPEIYRAVIVLRYYGNYDYDEIARQMGLPLTKVRSRLFRAKRLLRPILEPVVVDLGFSGMEVPRKNE